MNLTKFSIEKNRITYALLAIVILLGISLYQGLPRDSMPPMNIKSAMIVSVFPGAAPERVEELVTDRIEKVVQEIPELKEIFSTSRTGVSEIQVDLKDEVTPEEIQGIWDRLRRKLNGITELPEGVVPVMDDESIGDVYGIILGVTSDGYSYAEMKDYTDDLRDDLVKLDNAAEVKYGGAQDERVLRVFVEFDDVIPLSLVPDGKAVLFQQGFDFGIGDQNVRVPAVDEGGEIHRQIVFGHPSREIVGREGHPGY